MHLLDAAIKIMAWVKSISSSLEDTSELEKGRGTIKIQCGPPSFPESTSISPCKCAKAEFCPSEAKASAQENRSFSQKDRGMFQSAFCAMPGTCSLPRTTSAIVIVPWDLETQVPHLVFGTRQLRGIPWMESTNTGFMLPDIKIESQACVEAPHTPTRRYWQSRMWQREDVRVVSTGWSKAEGEYKDDAAPKNKNKNVIIIIKK